MHVLVINQEEVVVIDHILVVLLVTCLKLCDDQRIIFSCALVDSIILLLNLLIQFLFLLELSGQLLYLFHLHNLVLMPKLIDMNDEINDNCQYYEDKGGID